MPFPSALELIKGEDQVGLEIVLPGRDVQAGLVKTVDPAAKKGEVLIELVTCADEDPVLFIVRRFIGHEQFVEHAGVPGPGFDLGVVDGYNGIDPVPETVPVPGIGSEPLFNTVTVFQFDTADIVGKYQLLPDAELVIHIGFLEIAGRLHGAIMTHGE